MYRIVGMPETTSVDPIDKKNYFLIVVALLVTVCLLLLVVVLVKYYMKHGLIIPKISSY